MILRYAWVFLSLANNIEHKLYHLHWIIYFQNDDDLGQNFFCQFATRLRQIILFLKIPREQMMFNKHVSYTFLYGFHISIQPWSNSVWSKNIEYFNDSITHKLTHNTSKISIWKIMTLPTYLVVYSLFPTKVESSWWSNLNK